MIVETLIDWVIADLKIEKQFDIEDMELMRLGFTWTEVQNLSLYRRTELLEASTIVNDWKDILERRRNVEIATLSSGFASSESQQRIQKQWTEEIQQNLSRLRVYTLDAPYDLAKASDRGKPKRKFADVLKGLKNGKHNNIDTATQPNDQTHSESPTHGSSDTSDPLLQT